MGVIFQIRCILDCEDEIGLWWGAVLYVAACWRLREDDSQAWSIVESKFPYERNYQLCNSNKSVSPLPYIVLNALQAAKATSKSASTRFIEQAGILLEQSLVYYNCKQQSSQNVLVSIEVSYSYHKSRCLYI